uniref:Uncharacterized protein n=1 Tax=Anopheles atroparvus TaxID=41427 RepID=A0AAG5CNK0_ANOAO
MGFGRKHKYISTTIIAILHLTARLPQWRQRQRQLQCKSTHDGAARRSKGQQSEAGVRPAGIHTVAPEADSHRGGLLHRVAVRVRTVRSDALGGRTDYP